MTWADNEIDILRKDWADGLSASLIASHLDNKSRCAVIGKAHRIGLVEPDKPKLTFQRVRRIAPPHLVPPKPAPPKIELLPDQSLCAVTFLQLGDDHCRWPIGDSPFMYCGADMGAWPYCPRHHRISYRTPEWRSNGKT